MPEVPIIGSRYFSIQLIPLAQNVGEFQLEDGVKIESNLIYIRELKLQLGPDQYSDGAFAVLTSRPPKGTITELPVIPGKMG